MRNILVNQTINSIEIFKGIIISVIYFVLAVIVFYGSYHGAKKKGTLINIGE
jgi:hypothetical protein